MDVLRQFKARDETTVALWDSVWSHQSYEKKSEQKQLRLSYDKEADVLYLSFGEPQEAISEESEDGLLIRKHPQTGAVVGVTILDFEKRFEARNASARLPVAFGHVFPT